jgi:cell wall-associated NlpC family hydrolase
VRERLGLKALGAAVLALALILPAGGCGFIWGTSRLGPAAAEEARHHLGVPYRPGGDDPRGGFDCSGLAYYVYHRLGLELPRSSAKQAKVGRKIRRNRLRAGDLVFFTSTTKSRVVTHVGIYLGDRKFIHAPGRGKTVVISELDSEYYSRRYHSARRVS